MPSASSTSRAAGSVEQWLANTAFAGDTKNPAGRIVEFNLTPGLIAALGVTNFDAAHLRVALGSPLHEPVKGLGASGWVRMIGPGLGGDLEDPIL